MKRAKMKNTKVESTQIAASVRIYAPHSNITVGFAFDKITTKKWPKILRQLAESIESGALVKELDEMVGCYAYSVPQTKKKS